MGKRFLRIFGKGIFFYLEPLCCYADFMDVIWLTDKIPTIKFLKLFLKAKLKFG
jgi:hypothetical protein